MARQKVTERLGESAIGEDSFIRNGRFRVKHHGHGCGGCKSVYQTVSWRVVSLSLRDVMEGAIGVRDFSLSFGLLGL